MSVTKTFSNCYSVHSIQNTNCLYGFKKMPFSVMHQSKGSDMFSYETGLLLDQIIPSLIAPTTTSFLPAQRQ